MQSADELHKTFTKKLKSKVPVRTDGSKNQSHVKQTSLQMKKGILMKSVLKFISCSTRLASVFVQGIQLHMDMLPLLGQALNDCKSADGIKWLSIKGCHIHDAGLRSLTPYISRCSKLQALFLEDIAITGESMKYVVSILKANEAKMDSLLWSASLRDDIVEDSVTGNCLSSIDRLSKKYYSNYNSSSNNYAIEEIKSIYSKGLSLISLAGNKIKDDGIATLARHLRRNNYLTGLDMRGNHIGRNGYAQLKELMTLNHMGVVLLHGNPCCDSSTVPVPKTIVFNDDDDDDMKAEVEDDVPLPIVLSSTIKFTYLPRSVRELLKKWVQLPSSIAITEEISILAAEQQQEQVQEHGQKQQQQHVQLDDIEAEMCRHDSFECFIPSPSEGNSPFDRSHHHAVTSNRNGISSRLRSKNVSLSFQDATSSTADHSHCNDTGSNINSIQSTFSHAARPPSRNSIRPRDSSSTADSLRSSAPAMLQTEVLPADPATSYSHRSSGGRYGNSSNVLTASSISSYSNRSSKVLRSSVTASTDRRTSASRTPTAAHYTAKVSRDKSKDRSNSKTKRKRKSVSSSSSLQRPTSTSITSTATTVVVDSSYKSNRAVTPTRNGSISRRIRSTPERSSSIDSVVGVQTSGPDMDELASNMRKLSSSVQLITNSLQSVWQQVHSLKSGQTSVNNSMNNSMSNNDNVGSDSISINDIDAVIRDRMRAKLIDIISQQL